MSDSSEHADDQEERQRTFENIQRQIAKVNTSSSRAVTKSVALSNSINPASDLETVHSALVESLQNTRRILDRVETVIGNLESEYASPTPSQITSEHADRITETYDGPVRNLALMLLSRNRREWLHEKPDLNGAEQVRRHGLTKNQRTWLNELQDAWRAYDTDDD